MAGLFDPLDLGRLTLPNRIVMAPMTRSRADGQRAPTAMNAEYYAQRASAGLMITEATQICEQGIGYAGTPGIHTPEQVAGWKLVTDAVHGAGGRIFAQLWHVGRISHPSWQPGGALPVSSSAVAPKGEAWTPNGKVPFVTPHALSSFEIADIIGVFRKAASSALEAGFDGVELHAANGYLVDQFIRNGVNQRTDAYGGSVPNRLRLLLEVVEVLVIVWGSGRVGVRLSPTSAFNDMHDSNPAATFTTAADALNRFPLAYIHVLEGLPGSSLAPPEGVQPVAPMMRKAYRGRIVINGGYDQQTAERTLQEGLADLVAFGVPFLANPDLPERFRRGTPLNAPDKDTFYSPGERGYTDYPALA